MIARVLLVTSEFPPDVGGIGSHVAELSHALAPLVGEVVVMHPRAPGAPATDFAPMGVEVLRPALIRAQPFYTFGLAGQLKRFAGRRPFDIVHVHGVRPLAATRGLTAPTVFTNHSSGFLKRLEASPGRQRRTAALMTHVARLLAPSDELVEAARRLGYAGPAEMIPNGVDAERFHPGPSPKRAEWGIGPDEVVILLARRLAEKNGVGWFAQAVAGLKGLPCRIVIAGDGAERAGMVASLQAGGMLERTLFLGAVSNAEMPDIFRAADISVLPSLAEATSIAGLEAMASGLPLVGTDVGGIPTILQDGETGLLIPPKDAGALVAALERLVGDADLRQRLGSMARERAARDFSWATIARRTVDAYQAVLDKA